MAKSPALLSKLQGFADKLTGTIRVNNDTDPMSARNIAKRTGPHTSVQGETVSKNIKQIYSQGKQKTFGTPLK